MTNKTAEIVKEICTNILRKRLVAVTGLLVSVLQLCGCVYLYRSLDSASDDKASEFRATDHCEVSYLIDPLILKGKDFANAAYLRDYEKWTAATIRELGCTPKLVTDEANANLTIEVNEIPISMQYAQGERYLATLSLYLIPIPMEAVGYRLYEFGYRGQPTRRVRIVQKGWLGWVFLPTFPLSFTSFKEQGLFKSQLKEYLSGQ